MELKFKVDQNLVYDIIKQELSSSISGLIQDIANLEGDEELEKYQEEDLREHRTILEGLRTTLRYYTPASEWGNLGI